MIMMMFFMIFVFTLGFTLSLSFPHEGKTDIKEEFRVIPKSVQVAAGDSIVLQCSAPKAQPEPSIRWLKNNQPLSTATAGDFFIGDNQQQSLTPPPSPSSSSSHHQFQAQNGDKLERIKVLSSGFLRILNVVVEDQGRYSCVAENMAGSRESPSAILNVYVKPHFTKTPMDVLSMAGENVELHCNADGEPKPEINWSKLDGKLPIDRHEITEEKTLRIKQVQPGDDGDYVCEANSQAGSVTATALLTVHAPPKFIVKPENVIVRQGSEVRLQCICTGNPMPTLFWKRDTLGSQSTASKPMTTFVGLEEQLSHHLLFMGKSSSKMQVTQEGTLIIRNLHKDDEGAYSCCSISPLGSECVSASVSLLPLATAPIIAKGPQSQKLIKDSTALLRCELSSSGAVQIRWLLNGKEISLTLQRYLLLDSGTLQIHGVQPTDSGIYSCVTSNEAGESRASAELRVLDPNDSSARLLNDFSLSEISFLQLPGQPQIRQLSCDSFQLNWTPAVLSPISQTDYEIIGYTIEYFVSNGKRWHVAATNLHSTHHRLQQLPQQNEFVFLVRAQLGCRSSIQCQATWSEPSRVSKSVHSSDCNRSESTISSFDSFKTNDHLEKIYAELPLVQTVLLKARPHNTTALRVAWRIQQAQPNVINGLLLFYRPYPHIRLPHLLLNPDDSHHNLHPDSMPEPAAYTNSIDSSMYPLSVNSFQTTMNDHQSHPPNDDDDHRAYHGHHHHAHRQNSNLFARDAKFEDKMELQRSVRHPLLGRTIDSVGNGLLDYRVQLINTIENNLDHALITGLKPFTGYQVFAVPFHRLGMFALPSNLLVGHTAEALPNRAPTRIQIRVLESAAVAGLSTLPNGLNLNAMQSMVSGQSMLTSSETASSLESSNYQLPTHQLHSLMTNSLTNHLLPEHFGRRLIVELTWSHLPADHWRGMQRGYRLDFQLASSVVHLRRSSSDPISGPGFVLHVPTHHLLRNGHMLPNNTIQLTNLTAGDSYLLRISACTSAGCGVASVPVPLKVLPGFSYTLLADVNSGGHQRSHTDHHSSVSNSPTTSDDLSSNSADGPVTSNGGGGNGSNAGPEVVSTSVTKNFGQQQQALLENNGLRSVLLLLVGCFLLFILSLMLILSFVLLKRKNTTRLKKAVEGYMTVHLSDSSKMDCKLNNEKPHSFSQMVCNGSTGNSGWTNSVTNNNNNNCGGGGGSGSTSGHSTQSSECNSATVNNAGIGRRMTAALPPLPITATTNAGTESSSHYAEVEGHSMVTFVGGAYASGNGLESTNVGIQMPYNNGIQTHLHSVHNAEPYATTTLMMLNSAFNRERELIQDGGSSDQSSRFTGQQPLSQSGYASAVYQPSASLLMSHHNQHHQSQNGNQSADAGNSDSGSDVYGISRPNLSDHFRQTSSSIATKVSQFHSSVESVVIGNGSKDSPRMPLNNFNHLNNSYNSQRSNHSFDGSANQSSGYSHFQTYGNQTDKDSIGQYNSSGGYNASDHTTTGSFAVSSTGNNATDHSPPSSGRSATCRPAGNSDVLRITCNPTSSMSANSSPLLSGMAAPRRALHSFKSSTNSFGSMGNGGGGCSSGGGSVTTSAATFGSNGAHSQRSSQRSTTSEIRIRCNPLTSDIGLNSASNHLVDRQSSATFDTQEKEDDTEYSTLDCSITDGYSYADGIMTGNKRNVKQDINNHQYGGDERQPFLNQNSKIKPNMTEIYDLVPQEED